MQIQYTLVSGHHQCGLVQEKLDRCLPPEQTIILHIYSTTFSNKRYDFNGFHSHPCLQSMTAL